MAGTVTKLKRRRSPEEIEADRLDALSDSDFADEAWHAHCALARYKQAAIRRAEQRPEGFRRAEGECGRVSLSEPSQSNRFDRDKAIRDLGYETLKPFFYTQATDWTFRVTAIARTRA